MQKKKWMIGIVISFVLVLILGISYAYWYVTKSQEGMNQVLSGCFSLALQSDNKGIELAKDHPILTTEGLNLTPYTFTITNTCSIFASFDITLNTLLTSTLNSKYVAVVLDRNAVRTFDQYDLLETLEGYQESRLLQSGSLSPNDSETFNLRIWMDEDVGPEDMDAMNKIFQAKIAVIGRPSTYSPVEQGFDTLAEAMLVNEYQSTSVEHAKGKIKTKQAPDFSKPAPTVEWQEAHGIATWTPRPTMPHPDKVGEYNGFDKIEKSYLRFSHSYGFNRETGRYHLIDSFLADPRTITDFDTKDYYYCGGGTDISANDWLTVYQDYQNCSSIVKVSGVIAKDLEQTGPSGTKFQLIEYRIQGKNYTQLEKESDKSDKGLYMAMDDNGESFYYRGSVNNNYVKFAGFYWRIIRLNGDGSVRLLYAGETPDAEGQNLFINKQKNAYNNPANLPGYIGYMYGQNMDTYENASKNEINSSMKTILDNWYRKNMVEKGYSDKIADSIFCNDRELQSGDGVSVTKRTYYKPYQRLVYDKKPTLMCHQKGDQFTVSEEKGNGALTYPIGLITTDELMYAGITSGTDSYLNRLSYVSTTNSYWTMSSSWFNNDSGAAQGMYMDSEGCITVWYPVSYPHGIRAVINIRPEVKITSGIGTANDPFVVAD
ncbi:MAG: hypothetical protein HFH86_03850 [Bacilli bacterium]|nr:hypothetical protein [Bacilli bacterium]